MASYTETLNESWEYWCCYKSVIRNKRTGSETLLGQGIYQPEYSDILRIGEKVSDINSLEESVECTALVIKPDLLKFCRHAHVSTSKLILLFSLLVLNEESKKAPFIVKPWINEDSDGWGSSPNIDYSDLADYYIPSNLTELTYVPEDFEITIDCFSSSYSVSFGGIDNIFNSIIDGFSTGCLIIGSGGYADIYGPEYSNEDNRPYFSIAQTIPFRSFSYFSLDAEISGRSHVIGVCRDKNGVAVTGSQCQVVIFDIDNVKKIGSGLSESSDGSFRIKTSCKSNAEVVVTFSNVGLSIYGSEIMNSFGSSSSSCLSSSSSSSISSISSSSSLSVSSSSYSISSSSESSSSESSVSSSSKSSSSTSSSSESSSSSSSSISSSTSSSSESSSSTSSSSKSSSSTSSSSESSSSSSAIPWLGSWANRLTLTIDKDKVDSNESDFPVYINLSSSSGIGGVDVSAVFDELASDANRKKIAITSSDATTQLYVEIERWDDANEKAELHVKVPSVSSSVDTILYLYYDSAQADNTTYVGDTTDVVTHNVWDSNFKAVYHMAQDPNGDVADAIKDSTSNTNDGTPDGTMVTADLVDGQVGKAIDFDGTDDNVGIGVFLNTSNNFTISGCMKVVDKTVQQVFSAPTTRTVSGLTSG